MIGTCGSCGQEYDDNDGYDGLCGCPDDGLAIETADRADWIERYLDEVES